MQAQLPSERYTLMRRPQQAPRAWQGTGKECEELPDSSQGLLMGHILFFRSVSL